MNAMSSVERFLSLPAKNVHPTKDVAFTVFSCKNPAALPTKEREGFGKRSKTGRKYPNRRPGRCIGKIVCQEKQLRSSNNGDRFHIPWVVGNGVTFTVRKRIWMCLRQFVRSTQSFSFMHMAISCLSALYTSRTGIELVSQRVFPQHRLLRLHEPQQIHHDPYN